MTKNTLNKMKKSIICVLLLFSTMVFAQTPTAFVSWNDHRATDEGGIPIRRLFDPTTEIVVGYPFKREQPSCTVVGFSVICIKDTITTNGNHFSDEMRECFKKLKRCSAIQITDIKTIDKKGNQLSVSPITIRLECGSSFNPSLPVAELVCNGKFYKNGDTIALAEVLADTTYITARYNGFGEKVKNAQVREFYVTIAGMTRVNKGAGLDSSLKNILVEKTSDVNMIISRIKVTTNNKGAEETFSLSSAFFTLKKANK